LQAHGIGSRLIRVRLDEQMSQAVASAIAADKNDSDRDGQNDLYEYYTGTDPLNPESKFEIESLTYGEAVRLRWNSVVGKRYQLEYSDNPRQERWYPWDLAVNGDGKSIEIDHLDTGNSARFFRLRIRDQDSDRDGRADWSELVAGSDPSHPDVTTASMEATTCHVGVEVGRAVAIANRGETGAFRLVRRGWLGPMNVDLVPGGTASAGIDYERLPSTVSFDVGQRTAEVSVKPIGSSFPVDGLSVNLGIRPGPLHQVSAQSPVEIRLLSEHRISVLDHGATGNGVTDDTGAIQAALQALESSSTANTLWFPHGRYRLASMTAHPWTSGSYQCFLILNGGAATPRHLIFAG
jgi:hypothetical protein